MPSTTTFEAGDVVLVPFPFTDLRTAKKRPALVLAKIAHRKMPDLFVLAMITSQIDGTTLVGDCLLSAWEAAGLPKSSKVRLAKIVTVENDLIIKKLGELKSSDMVGVKKAFKAVFSEIL